MSGGRAVGREEHERNSMTAHQQTKMRDQHQFDRNEKLPGYKQQVSPVIF